MKIERCREESFIVIGKEGVTTDGAGSIQELWGEANSHFREIQNLARKDENGNTSGIWDTVSDSSRSSRPWEDFSRGLYLMRMECNGDAEAPDGWAKWVIPGHEYTYVERESNGIFPKIVQHPAGNDITLVGAIHKLTCPQTGKGYVFFPVKKL